MKDAYNPFRLIICLIVISWLIWNKLMLAQQMKSLERSLHTQQRRLKKPSSYFRIFFSSSDLFLSTWVCVEDALLTRYSLVFKWLKNHKKYPSNYRKTHRRPSRLTFTNAAVSVNTISDQVFKWQCYKYLIWWRRYWCSQGLWSRCSSNFCLFSPKTTPSSKPTS